MLRIRTNNDRPRVLVLRQDKQDKRLARKSTAGRIWRSTLRVIIRVTIGLLGWLAKLMRWHRRRGRESLIVNLSAVPMLLSEKMCTFALC